MTVLAAHAWRDNAELIEAIGRGDLPYLFWSHRVLDLTYGRGNFWTRWRPRRLIGCDAYLDPAEAKTWPGVSLLAADFTRPPFRPGSFDAVVFDPPYKLNGTSQHPSDRLYGVHQRASRDDRHRLMLEGMWAGARLVRPGGHLLVKCQAQVESGQVRWQDDMMTSGGYQEGSKVLGLVKVDRFDVLGLRAQPPRPCTVCRRPGAPAREPGVGVVDRYGQSIICPRCAGEGRAVPPQQHAARNSSQLLIFRKT